MNNNQFVPAMKEHSFDIDRQGDELVIKMKIFNPKKYDPINRRTIRTHAILELLFHNQSESQVQVKNPELVVYQRGIFSTEVSRYNSSELQTEFPKVIDPKSEIRLGYSSKQIEALLGENRDEIVKFQIISLQGKNYSSKELDGDSIERLIEEKNTTTFWESRKVYSFDQEI